MDYLILGQKNQNNQQNQNQYQVNIYFYLDKDKINNKKELLGTTRLMKNLTNNK